MSKAYLCVCLVLAVGVIGCGTASPDAVSGKVTLNGQPVAGEVVFLVGGAEKAASPIKLDGTYQVSNPPRGEVEVLVKGPPALPSPPPGGKKVDIPPPTGSSPSGVSPPAKYARPNNGLAKLNVTGGRQTHNIELTP